MSLWYDNWSDQALVSSFPQLHSFARKDNCSLRFFLDNEMSRVFFLPLSVQASNQLTELQENINGMHLEHMQKDKLIYNWGSTFFSKKAYSHLQGILEASPLFKWI